VETPRDGSGFALAVRDRMRIIAVICIAGCHVAAYGPTDITVTTGDPASFVAFRDASADWQTVTPVGDPFVVTVHGPYEITVVCDDGSGFVAIWRFAQTPDDDHAIGAPCSESVTAFHDVTGTMVQPGMVTVGFATDAKSTANWPFDITVPVGIYDLVATTDDHVAIRRDVTVAGATSVPPVDVVQQGVPLDPLPVTATNTTPGDSVFASVHLDTSSTYAIVYSGSLDGVVVVPQSLVSTTDRELVIVRDVGPSLTHQRGLARELHAGSSTTFVLPTEIPAVAFDVVEGGIDASWSSLPDWDTYDFSIEQFVSTTIIDDLTLSPSYLRETGSTSIAIGAIPGFRPAWTVDPFLDHNRSFAGYTIGGEDTQYAEVSEDVVNGSTVTGRSDRSASVGSGRARSRRRGF
jgi:hypothetical protein